MKTAFLKGLGLEKEVIDEIMAENGKDIAAEQAKTTALQAQLDTANNTIKERDTQLETLKNSPENPETLKRQIAQLQADNQTAAENHAKELRNLKKTSIQEKVLNSLKAKNTKAALALIDEVDDETKDFDEVNYEKNFTDKAKELMESDDYLFEKESTTIKGLNPDNSDPKPKGDKPDSEKTYEEFLAEFEN